MGSGCPACGGFVGEPGKVYGYAGKWCHCGTLPRTNLQDFLKRMPMPAPVNPCNCVGPQRGEPLCPCAMRGVVIKNGRYVRPEQDLGPAPQGTP